MRRSMIAPLLVAGVILGILLSSQLLAREVQPRAPRATSPLADYLGFGHHPNDEDSVYQREEVEREALVASCMDEAGFLYVPQPTALEAPGATGVPTEPDPNEAYREALDPARAKAYWLAYTGLPGPEAELDAAAMTDYDRDGDGRLSREEQRAMGCLGRASAEIPGVFGVKGLLREQLQAMHMSIASDPRTETADQEWRRCLQDLGLVASTRTDYEQLVRRGLVTDEKRTSVEACDDQHSATVAEVRAEAERTFYEENQQVITENAYPYPYSGS